ncbi:hypothetical protein BS47DRAFT_1485564 [Hydnum rufescens UP504]|uniref:Transglutaminase-like domain-containing protein n=1 Tax=Hydnum rufescens UP504 TaxID=1448309 RepID=A0A9P6AX33_9AGAM|nr:hypothetical protein BS47DRAFT_1485564 [Hydnum rufescens UP504]
MDGYERLDLLDIAISHIPIQDLYETADRIQASNTPLPCFEDALAEALVKWFKPTFMVWVDPILCPICNGSMECRAVQGPSTDEERKGGAGRVEIHGCNKVGCGGVVRFPRYNDLAALMKSRKGRCGEFANLFTLFLRAVGLRARYVWNAEDHVWNEYYSPGQDRWVHLDSCENARDQHHLYSNGWGKKMSLVVAFSTDGAHDVSRAYIPEGGQWEEAMRMRKYSEDQLSQVVRRITQRGREGRPKEEFDRLEREDERDRTWWQEEGEGRKSGTQEWKDARGEGGK